MTPDNFIAYAGGFVFFSIGALIWCAIFAIVLDFVSDWRRKR